MFNARGSRTVTEEESGMDLSSKRASYLERRARLLSDVSVSSSSSHSSEPDPDSLAGMRLRGSPVPSPGGPRNGTRGQAGPSNGVDFADEWSTKGVAKTCEYVGSFSVAHLQPNNRAEFVRLQLQSLQDPKRSRPVALFISLAGIKVFDPDNQQVTLMAHALKRISYATCDPEFCQFAFLSRNPRGPVGVQYCHVFITREQHEAEEINAIVGKAFKVAYASLRSKKQFFELMEELNREQEEYFAQITRQQNTAAVVEDWMDGDINRERVLSVGQGRVWAKQVAGRIQHKQPHIIAAIDPALQVVTPPSNRCKTPSPPNSNHQSQASLMNNSSPDVSPKGGSANQNVCFSGGLSGETAEEFEWLTEEDIEEARPHPSASSLQEVSVKQTQRTIPLPPAPYYEVELRNAWPDRSIANPAPNFIIHEQKTQLVLQSDQSASSSRTSMALTETHRVHTPGQILLQDSTVPPPFNYKPKEDGDCYGYGNGYSDMDRRLSDYTDRDSFDYDRSYAILEQFINATCDISVLDPNLRVSPVSREFSDRPFSNIQCEEDADSFYTRTQMLDAIRTNNNLHKAQQSEKNANIPVRECESRPQPAQRKGMPLVDRPSEVQCQKSSSPPTNQGQRLSRHTSQEDHTSHMNGQAMNINQNANEEPSREKPTPAPRKLKGPAPPIPVEAKKVTNIDQSSEKNNLKRSASSASAANSGAASGRVLEAPKSLDIASAAAEGQRMLKSFSSVASQDSFKKSGGRSPGHIGHKVEVEIGKFRCKKVTNNGVAPPLPPRSTSLIENGISQDGSSFHGNPLPYRDITEAPWFKAGVPREIAVEILQQEEKGAFIVRESKSHPGCFALSIKVDLNFNESGIANYLVVRTKNGGYTIKGFGRDFADLPRLVHHYSFYQEQLPCKLVLSRCNPLFRQDEEEGDEEGGGDLDFTSMTDFKPVMDGMK
ncbi:uncharacterized protein [Asterias amurensis]|uniref:uncharacterized protein isoform X1 n=2 Tax=Asterias amurensis TaxID=7602 RepID=UPI003AB7F535